MLKLKSSNPYKISEYQRLLKSEAIQIEAGDDLKEVLGTAMEVIIHKAIDSGEDVLVEDTTLIVNGVEEVEIKWKQDELKDGDKVTWVISLGLVRNGKVEIYRAEKDLIVDRSFGKDGVAFEPFLVPVEDNPDRLSYTLLSKAIDKDIIDPRAMAVRKFLAGEVEAYFDKDSISPWDGDYQND